MGCLESKDKDKKPQTQKLKMRDSTAKPIGVKIVLLGDTGVGKSSICQKYINKKINNTHEVTIGGIYLEKEVVLNNGQKVNIHIWDTCGEERYRSAAHMYYRDAQAALLIYDVTSVESFQSLDYWVHELDEKVRDDNMVLIMVGNKYDLPDKKVSHEQVKAFADKEGIHHVEVSAQTGDGINELFMYLAQELIKKTSNGKSGK